MSFEPIHTVKYQSEEQFLSSYRIGFLTEFDSIQIDRCFSEERNKHVWLYSCVSNRALYLSHSLYNRNNLNINAHAKALALDLVYSAHHIDIYDIANEI